MHLGMRLGMLWNAWECFGMLGNAVGNVVGNAWEGLGMLDNALRMLGMLRNALVKVGDVGMLGMLNMITEGRGKFLWMLGTVGNGFTMRFLLVFWF